MTAFNPSLEAALAVSVIIASMLLPGSSFATTTTEAETNRPGGDYESIELSHSEPNACRAACDSDAGCKAYTYVRPGIQGRLARCFLKNTVPDPVADTCCVSGIKISGPIPRPPPAPTPAPAAKAPEACPVSSCSKGVATLNQTGDRANDCVTTAVIPCFPYSCDGNGNYCGAACSTNADCATGAHCNTTVRACAPYGYVCKDSFTVESSDGSDTSCSPYKCSAGQCRDSCSAPADCDRNHRCIGGVCVKM